MSEFTPGPWRWDASTLRGKDRNAILNPSFFSGVSPQRYVNRPADAALIAAAPSLYEALEAAEQKAQVVIDAYSGAIPAPAAVYEIEDLARAALALARGESEGP